MAAPGNVPTTTGARETRLAYGATLVLLVASVVASIASTGRGIWPNAGGVMQAVALIITMRVSGARRRSVITVTALALVATVSAAGLAGVEHPLAPALGPALWALIVLATIGAIGRRVSRMEQVDLQTVLGLLSTYVLLGLLFAYVFMVAGAAGQTFFTQGNDDLGSYVYFSYVTLATVGYGDLTATAGFPQALAVAEAIIGQLYLVTVVALAVSQFSGRRQR
jgi:hypothetical protein